MVKSGRFFCLILDVMVLGDFIHLRRNQLRKDTDCQAVRLGYSQPGWGRKEF